MKGIDVAKWNGVIDWKKVKEDGVQFAILKAINKQCKTEDAFNRNYDGALSVGLPIDVYNYSYATSVSKATSDAQAVLNAIKGKKIGTVWLDVEDKIQMNLGMTLIDIINAYKYIIEKAGYGFGVYTGLSFYNTLIKPFHSFLDCKFWIARYPSGAVVDLNFEPAESKKPNIIHALWGWQYTSTGKVNGISGNVDLDIRYNDPAKDNIAYPVLRKGSSGVYVEVLQKKLNDAGYNLSIDGDFGKKTLEAVKDYQKVNGLVVDGIVGQKTWDKLCK